MRCADFDPTRVHTFAALLYGLCSHGRVSPEWTVLRSAGGSFFPAGTRCVAIRRSRCQTAGDTIVARELSVDTSELCLNHPINVRVAPSFCGRALPSSKRAKKGRSGRYCSREHTMQIFKLAALLGCISVGATVAFADLNASVDRPKYAGPKGGNARLDQCFSLGKNCGQTAANKYCEMFGYQRAKSFTTEHASATQTMHGEKCSGSVCVAFKEINCTTTATKVGQKLGWPQGID